MADTLVENLVQDSTMAGTVVDNSIQHSTMTGTVDKNFVQDSSMAGTVVGNLSSRKLGMLCVLLTIVLLACFLLGGLVCSALSSSMAVLGTICVDHDSSPKHWFQVWGVPLEQNQCHWARSVEELMDSDIVTDQIVFAFQMPLRKHRQALEFSRWQQHLIGILQLDIDYDERYDLAPNATLTVHVRLGYKDKSDPTEEWTLLAESVDERQVECELYLEDSHRYYCQLLPLFELASLHHDYYLLNLRLLTEPTNNRNVDIKRLTDITLVNIFQNGRFTKIWVSMKTAFFMLVLALTVWVWRRVHTLQRQATLVECMIFALAVSLIVLNVPLEYLTLLFDMPYMLLITDIRQGVFYAILLSFWLVFAGEHVTIDDVCDRNRLAAYWKHLSAVIGGCILLFIFHICEHSVQLTNPFFSIWNTHVGTNLALGLIFMVGVSACLYLIFLFWVIWRVWCGTSVQQQALPARSLVHRPHCQQISCRCKFVMLATALCAVMTVISFFLGQIAEGRGRWHVDINVACTSAVVTGVYGMWNVYTVAVLSLYAPSRERWSPAHGVLSQAKLES